MMPVHKKESRSAPSIGSRIIAGLTQFRTALKNKEPIARRFTVRTVELDLEPEAFSPLRLLKIRESMGASQAIFAQLLGMSVHTIRSWEQGNREPSRIARRLLEDMEANPNRWIKILKSGVSRKAATA